MKVRTTHWITSFTCCLITMAVGCTSKSEPETQKMVLKEDQTVARLLPENRKEYLHLSWNVIAVHEDGTEEIVRLNEEFSTRRLQVLLRHQDDGAVELFIPKGTYDVPASWFMLVFRIGAIDVLKDGSLREGFSGPTTIRIDNPNSGPWNEVGHSFEKD